MRLRCLLVLFFFALSLRAEVRFAWLSDTHVGSQTGAADLEEVVAEINERGGIDFVLLTGDITEYGSDEQLWAARNILNSLVVPYHILPGNHDLKWSESGGTTFSHLWGADKFVFEVQGYRFIGMHQGPRMRMADGHFAREDIFWLDSVLADRRSEKQPILFATHYPLDSSISNWYEVLDRLKRVDARMAFVGHGHANRIESYEGLPALMGCSILRGRSVGPAYNIVTLRNDSTFVEEHEIGRQSVRMWYSAPMLPVTRIRAESHWPRPDFSVNRSYTQVSVVWTFQADATVASTPAVTEKAIVVGDASGVVYGINRQTGGLLWKFRTGGPVYSSPDTGDGCVVFGSSDGNIYCLRTTDGSERWRIKTGRAVLGSPAIRGGHVFIAGSDRCMRAIDLHSGEILWTQGDLGGFVEARPLVTTERVLFGAWDGNFYALSISTGRLEWRWAGEKKEILFSPAACWPVATKGIVYIVAPDRAFTALQEASGKELFRTNRYQVRESIGLSTDSSAVYVRTMRDSLVAFIGGVERLEVSWTAVLNFGHDINAAMPIERDGVVYYGTQKGFLYALNASTGKCLWIQRLGAVPLNTVHSLSGGQVVTTDFDGKVRLIEADK